MTGHESQSLRTTPRNLRSDQAAPRYTLLVPFAMTTKTMPHTHANTSLHAPKAPTKRSARSVRCPRCTNKFRTPRDLALHIISKHGHVRLHAAPNRADDARSVTLFSPAVMKCQLAELDTMLCDGITDLKPSQTSTESAFRACASEERKQNARYQKLPKRNYSTPSSPHSFSSSVSDSSHQPHRQDLSYTHQSRQIRQHRIPRALRKRPQTNCTDGESIGPPAADVLVKQCRVGQVSLVPVPTQTPVMLNFANGLF